MTAPISQPEPAPPNPEVHQTPLPGMPFLNRLLGGGLPSGKLIGLVAPTGGGKTLLGLQTAFTMTTLSERILYIGIERGNLLQQRAYRLICGISSGNDEKMTAQRIALQDRINPLFSVIDRDSFDFAASIQDLVAELASIPALIVVDQLELWMRGRNITPSRRTISTFCAKLKAYARQSGIPILLLHQTRASLKTEPAVRKPTIRDAMNSTAFGNDDVDACIFLSPLNPQNICWMSNPAEDRHELVWLDGDCGRFRSLGPLNEAYEIRWNGEYRDGRKEYDFTPTTDIRSLGGSSATEICGLLNGSKPISENTVTLPPESDTSATDSEDNPFILTDTQTDLFLSAANCVASALTLDHGRKMIALMHPFEPDDLSLIPFVLWCRCNGRKDFIDMLTVESGGNAVETASAYSPAALRNFYQWLLEQAAANGWNGQTNVPEFALIPEDTVRISHLFDCYSKYHSNFLQNDWHNHRLALAETAAVSLEGTNCEVKLGEYNKKNNKLLTWNRARQLFIDHSVSPSAFFTMYARTYKAIPWPASFPVLIDNPPEPPTFEPRHNPSTPEKALQILLHDDLLPWEIGLLTLHIGTGWSLSVNFVEPFFWALLSWEAIGNEQMICHIEHRLSPSVQQEPPHPPEDHEEQHDCNLLR